MRVESYLHVVLLLLSSTLRLIAFDSGELIDEGPSLYQDGYLHDMYFSGLRRVTAKAKTLDCKLYIEFEYMKYIRAMAEESPFPFEDEFFHSQCPTSWDTYTPILPVYMKELPAPPNYTDNPVPNRSPIEIGNMSILYVMLVHNHASFAERLIAALDEPQHTFVIHVDLFATDVYHQLKKMSTGTSNIFVMDEDRQSVNWGGYSVVNATLQAMKTAWMLQRPFDYMIDISGTSYPIKSNEAIRRELAQKPAAVYMDVHATPNVPPADMWHHYVECDDALHRIGRLTPARGMHMHVGSQWFAVPRHVVQWFLENPLPYQYAQYAQHVVVADENYFATLFMNSPYCGDLVPKNMLFVLFDKWENERNAAPQDRDTRKCLHPDPDHCGRSPTTLTMRYQKLLEISRATFARKFDPADADSMALVDLIDRWRAGQTARSAAGAAGSSGYIGDEGNSLMIRYSGLRDVDTHGHTDALTHAQAHAQTLGPESDVCWEMHEMGHFITLSKCNPDLPSQWFTLGPCTDRTNVSIIDGACPLPQEGQEEMYCQLQSTSRNLCVDINGESPYMGTNLIGWECSGQWNQLFRLHADCGISAVQPDLIGRVRGFEEKNITMCFRANADFTVVSTECETEYGVVVTTKENTPTATGTAAAVASYNSSDTSGVVTKVTANSTAAEKKAAKEREEKRYRRRVQQFEFLKKDGSAYKVYEKVPVKATAADTVRDAVGTPRETNVNIPRKRPSSSPSPGIVTDTAAADTDQPTGTGQVKAQGTVHGTVQGAGTPGQGTPAAASKYRPRKRTAATTVNSKAGGGRAVDEDFSDGNAEDAGSIRQDL